MITLFNGAGIPLFPGPDLACQDAVMESKAFVSSENSCISKSRRARAGHYFYPVKLIFYFTGARCEAIHNSLKKLL